MNLHGETLSLFYDLLPQEVEHKVGGLSTKKRCASRLSGLGQLGVQLFHHRHMVDRWWQITLRIVGYHFTSGLTATLNLCLIYFKIK